MRSESGTPRYDWGFPFAGLTSLVPVVGLLAINFQPEWWANYFYVEGRCVLLDKRLVEYLRSGTKGRLTARIGRSS